MAKSWFKLDNAGKLYSSITSSRSTTIFRISADIIQKIKPDILQHALNNIMNRFPYFNVNIKRGVFWYYFDSSDTKPKIEKEIYYPCMYLNIKKKGVFPFRVLYYKNKLSVEFSHSITDGSGAIVFIKSLLFEYFRLQGIKLSKEDGIFTCEDEPDEEEFEDAFKKYYNEKIPSKSYKKKAFHFPFKLIQKGVYYVVIGIIPVSEVLKKSKEYGTTLTEFLCAIYFDTILEFIENNKYKKRPIVLNIPVNLRKMFPSKTIRNFFISVTPEIDPRLGKYTFKDILKYVHNYMTIKVDEKYINQQIKRNVKSERSFFLRIFPLFLKDLGMPLVYNIFGESNYTSGFSNLGIIKLPKELENLVERVEVYPPPSQGNKIKVALATYKDKLYISFGKLTENKEIECIFFRKLRKMNIPVKVETNYDK